MTATEDASLVPAQTGNDIPIAVHGFVTDPKLVGYQILTNYESAYWRALVGSDAWSLYEVLRSFCHEGNNTCYPSVNLLMAILGIKDRRTLTGRIVITDGREYRYPGVVDVLQDHNLIISEVEGEGPKMRYIFHVNLTPGLLTDDQLSELPTLLQKKHIELLERHEQSIMKLEAKKRPSKVPKAPQNGRQKGSGNFPEGSGSLPEGSGNFPPEQHPINNTHKTRTLAHEDHNNSSDELAPKQAVVVALIDQGISEKVAQRLAQRHSQERLSEKIEFLEFLLAERPEDVKKPAAWLRRAIEEDYGRPDGFLTQEERERQKLEEAHKAQVEEEQARANEEARQAVQAQLRAQQEAERQVLYAQYGTTPREVALWQQVLADLKMQLPDATFHAYMADTLLLSVTEEQAVVGLTNPLAKDWVENRLSKRIGDTVAMHLGGRKITVQWVSLDRRAG